MTDPLYTWTSVDVVPSFEMVATVSVSAPRLKLTVTLPPTITLRLTDHFKGHAVESLDLDLTADEATALRDALTAAIAAASEPPP